jgi:hypothetical protein
MCAACHATFAYGGHFDQTLIEQHTRENMIDILRDNPVLAHDCYNTSIGIELTREELLALSGATNGGGGDGDSFVDTVNALPPEERRLFRSDAELRQLVDGGVVADGPGTVR